MLNNNRGAALAMVILVLAVGMVLGGVVLFLGTHETQMTYATENLTRAYYVARSGADAMGEYIINNPEDISVLMDQSSDPASIGDGEATITDMEAFTEDSVDKIRIVAEGVVPGGYTRTATLVLKHFNGSSLFEYGLFSEENLNATKIDDVDTTDGSDFLLGSNGTIDTNNNYPDGDYVAMQYQNMDYPEPTFPGDPNPITGVIDVPLPPTEPDIEGNGDDNINADAVYSRIYKNGGSLTFHAPGNQDLYVVVSEIDLNCDVIVNGTGTVHLYIRNGSESPDGNFMTPINIGANAEQFRIYLEADAELNLQANLTSYCYIYGPGAEIQLAAQSSVTGAIIAESYTSPGKPDITFEPLTDDDEDDAVNGYKRDRWED